MQAVAKFTFILIVGLLLGVGIGTLIQRKLDEQLLSSVNATTNNGTISQQNGTCIENPVEADRHAKDQGTIQVGPITQTSSGSDCANIAAVAGDVTTNCDIPPGRTVRNTGPAIATGDCAIANSGSMNSVNVDCGGEDAPKNSKKHR